MRRPLNTFTQRFTRVLRPVEWVFAVGTVLGFSGAIHATVETNLASVPMNLTVRFVGGVVIFGATLLLLAVGRARVKPLLQGSWPLFVPAILAGASVLWSISPYLSLRASLNLTGTTMFGLFLAARFDLEDQLKVVALALGMAGIASIVYALVLPEYGLMKGDYSGLWKGVFVHKNIFARTLALAILVYFFLASTPSKSRLIALLGLATCVFLLLKTGSRAGMLVTLVSLGWAGLLWVVQPLTPNRRRTILAAAWVGGLVTASWTLANLHEILAFMGKDATLGTRTAIWRELLQLANLRPWLGYGYDAFWHGDSAQLKGVLERLQYFPGHGHNGFLDLGLELGIVGLAAFLVPFLIYAAQAYAWGMAQLSPIRLWPIAYLAFFALSNVGESALLRQNQIYWALYVATVMTFKRPDILAAPGQGPMRSLFSARDPSARHDVVPVSRQFERRSQSGRGRIVLRSSNLPVHQVQFRTAGTELWRGSRRSMLRTGFKEERNCSTAWRDFAFELKGRRGTRARGVDLQAGRNLWN